MGGKILVQSFAPGMTVTCDLWWRKRAAPLGKGNRALWRCSALNSGPERFPVPPKQVWDRPLKARGRSQRQLADWDQASEVLTRAQLKGAPKHSGIETNVVM